MLFIVCPVIMTACVMAVSVPGGGSEAHRYASVQQSGYGSARGGVVCMGDDFGATTSKI